ncbi:hypothetical protein ACMZ7W_02340 [Gardnerella vaginalis]|uniref:hypothetical protein n=1 Tax=Gardnerella vaginalis TaxID=2702 RepID=UPI0039EE764B
MLSKKAIATFAAMATFVSGIAFAMPALANSETPVQTNSAGESAKHPSVEKLEDRVKGSRLLSGEIDEILKYISDNASKVTGKGKENDAVFKHVNEMIVKYRAMHLDVIGLHDLAKQMREASNFKSANKIFYGSKDDRNKAQSAYVKGKADLVKKAKEAGLDSIAKRIEESNYNTLHYLTSVFKYEDRINKEALAKQAQEKEALAKQAQEKEDLAKQAEAKGLSFTAKIIRDSKKSNLNLLKNLLAEAEKIKKSESAKAPELPNAAGQDSPEVSPEASPEDKSVEAPAAPSVPAVPSVPGAAAKSESAKSESAKSESAAKPSQAKAVVPAAPASVDQLKPELKGMLTVGSNNIAVAGSANKVSVNVNNKAFLDRLHREGSAKAYAFIYSTPKILRSVDGSDFVTVKLGSDGVPYFDAQFPAGYSGKHTVVLVDEQGNQLGWTDITVENNTAGQGDGKGVLPATGVGGALVAFAALMFAAFGAVLRKVRS